MTDTTFQQVRLETRKETDSVNLQAMVAQILNFWWLFLLFIFLSLFTAYVYLRYSASSYKINGKILVKDSKKGGDISQGSIFSDLELLNPISSVDNEVELLKSRSLMERTVSGLQLNVRYFSKGSVKQTETFFSKLPFIMKGIYIVDDSLSEKSMLTFNGVDENTFSLDDGKARKKVKYGDTISLNFARIVFYRFASNPPVTASPVVIKFTTKDATVAGFQNSLTVAPTSKTVSTIDLSLIDNLPERGELLINTLIRIYNDMNTDDRNRTADSTIKFIDNRLIYVTQELGNVEQDIQNFKQSNNITDISMQSQLLLQNTSLSIQELGRQEAQLNVLRSLQSYLKADKNYTRTIPAALAIQDPTFEGLVQNYNTLQLEKERQLATTTENNPLVEKLTVQILNLRKSIMSSLAAVEQTMLMGVNQLQKRTDLFSSQIKGVPQKEKNFLEISRQQTIKQELYLYLLKKREETAVSKAANLDNARIVDSAKSQKTPVKPKRSIIYLLAFIAGIVIPGLLLYIRFLLYNKVENRSDITSYTHAPIVGEIGRSPFPNNLIVRENSRHPVAEQFRLLRTNLDYMNVQALAGGRTIMVTSNMSGEGKSFISLNLAGMLALGGKRVVLLEFDLRKPKLSKYLGFNNNEGISTFLVNRSKSIEELTVKVPGIDTLFFTGSGPTPPNPAELIHSERTDELFAQLEQNFDHVIIDVPPVGVVTDALLLAKYAKISLFVIRQGFTYKKQLEQTDELYRQQKLPNFALVVNDIERKKGYGYGYGYGNSFGYGYTEEKDLKKKSKK